MHLKREVAPKFWPIARKRKHWAVRPIPGPHPIKLCIPLLVVIRDVLSLAETAKEAEFIVGRGYVKVDGKVRVDPRFPVGLMDVIEVEKLDKVYRVLPCKRGLTLKEIPKKEASLKLCKIEGKTTLKGGRVQLNLHDGRNILVQEKPADGDYKINDVLMMRLPSQELLKRVKFGKNSLALITGGKYAGKRGVITNIESRLKSRQTGSVKCVTIKSGEEKFSVLADHVFVIGVQKPLVSIPGD
jgi:small subunit ribosomal protein S4e